MNGFTRYVLRQLLIGMALVTAGLTCVIWLTQSLRFVEMIVNRGLSSGSFIYLTGLLLPNFLTVILPIALFTVVIFTYAKMITDRELIVMRAAGQSQLALSRPAMILALLTMALGYLLNLYLVPHSYDAFRELQWDIRHSFSHVLLKEGEFNNVTNATTVYVRERSVDGQLHGILVHDTRKPESPFSLMAERGAMIDTENGSKVVMFKGNRQEVDRKTKKLTVIYFDRWVYDLDIGPSSRSRYREARERSLGELFDVAADPKTEARERGKFTVEAHKRLTTPIRGLAFTAIALACLLSGGFSRRTQTSRILIAVGCMIGLQGLALGMENLVARQLHLIPLLYVVSALPVLISIIVLLRPPRKPKAQCAPIPA